MRASATISQLYSKVSKTIDKAIDDFELELEGNYIKKELNGTLKENGIVNNSEIYVILCTTMYNAYLVPSPRPGFVEPDMFFPCADCLQPIYCPFNSFQHVLSDQVIWQMVATKRDDAYSVICDIFNISPEIEKGIEDATASATIRFGSTLHHLYHKNTNLTWQKIVIIIKEQDLHLARLIHWSLHGHGNHFMWSGNWLQSFEPHNQLNW